MINRKHFELTQALLVNVPGFPGFLVLVPLGEKQNTKKKRMIIQIIYLCSQLHKTIHPLIHAVKIIFLLIKNVYSLSRYRANKPGHVFFSTVPYIQIDKQKQIMNFSYFHCHFSLSPATPYLLKPFSLLMSSSNFQVSVYDPLN